MASSDVNVSYLFVCIRRCVLIFSSSVNLTHICWSLCIVWVYYAALWLCLFLFTNLCWHVLLHTNLHMPGKSRHRRCCGFVFMCAYVCVDINARQSTPSLCLSYDSFQFKHIHFRPLHHGCMFYFFFCKWASLDCNFLH